MDPIEFRSLKQKATLRGGELAYAVTGEGSAALFVHGVFTNGALWRNVVEEARADRTCIAPDLPAHGDTRLGGELSIQDHADLLVELLDSIGVDQVDLVGNDTGGAICQVIAVTHTSRVRTLTLTNCDVHDNVPPEAFKPAIKLAQRGEFAPIMRDLASDYEAARSEAGLGVGYEHPENISDELIDSFLGPFRDIDRAREIERRMVAVVQRDLTEIEPLLRKLDVPVLLAWGTGDNFFDVSWAYWLRDRLPHVEDVIEIEGAKLFFPDERGAELAGHLRRFWSAHPAGLASTAQKGAL